MPGLWSAVNRGKVIFPGIQFELGTLSLRGMHSYVLSLSRFTKSASIFSNNDWSAGPSSLMK